MLIIIQPFKNSLNWSFTRKNHLYIQNAKTECLWGITMEDLLFWLLDPLSKSLYLFYHYRHYNQHNLLQCLPRVCSLFGQRKNVPDIFYMYSLSFLNILQKSTFYSPNFFVTTTARKILTSELVEHANRLKLVVCYRY